MRQQLKYTEISLNKENSEPLYLQLAGALRRQIGMTCLNSNERMISERRLSEQLGVDRTTVSKAYCELLKEGLLTRWTSKTLCISAESRRKLVAPFPNIGIIIPQQFSSLIEANSLTMHYIKGIIDSAAARNISTIMIQFGIENSGTSHRNPICISQKSEGAFPHGNRIHKQNNRRFLPHETKTCNSRSLWTDARTPESVPPVRNRRKTDQRSQYPHSENADKRKS